MSAAFTPGPWGYFAHVYSIPQGTRVGKVAEIALAYKDSATRDANGFLIAAAPELYEALAQFAALEIPKRADGNAGLYSIPFERIARARAALAKARGDAA